MSACSPRPRTTGPRPASAKLEPQKPTTPLASATPVPSSATTPHWSFGTSMDLLVLHQTDPSRGRGERSPRGQAASEDPALSQHDSGVDRVPAGEFLWRVWD